MRRINIFWSIILLFFSAYSQNENLRPEQILKEHRAIPVSDCSKIDSVVALAESKKRLCLPLWDGRPVHIRLFRIDVLCP